MITRIAIATAVLFASPAWSSGFGFYSGNQLFDYCEGAAKDKAHCIGYTTGIVDALASGPIYGWEACVPEKVSQAQVRDIVVKYLQDNPQDRHYSAAAIAAKALSIAFPCQ